MSKVAMYLQEHISGEVVTNTALLRAMSHDMSVLEMMPEMVVYPRLTNDIRKVARFAWQLAEKGHVLPLTARGNGTDQTGAAIGKGIILSLPAHMDNILEFDAKQKLVRVQPGINIKTLNDALLLHGVGIPAVPLSSAYNTIGGAVANNATGPLAGKYGDMTAWTHQLEVVLANGDILQTQRLSKRELNKKKGLQTFEGEVYRSLDNLIEDNKEVIGGKIASNIRDNVGYSSLAKVKQKDGSFDLTPLFVGSQGTLGIISEMIMKSEFISGRTSVAVAAFASKEAARDAIDQLLGLEPAFIEYYDGDYFAIAATQGKKYEFAKGLDGPMSAVLLLGFDDFNERARHRKLKKAHKQLEKSGAAIRSAEDETADELLAIRGVTAYSAMPLGKEASAPPLFDGVYIPRERFEEFSTAVATLAAKHNVTLPLHGRVLDSVYSTRPTLQLHKVGDKQKIFKLLDEYSQLVDQFGGHLIADGGEGRMKARFAHTVLDEEVTELFAAVKAIFDPYGILNPGVKQSLDVRQLVSHLRADYDTASISDHVPYN